MNGRGGPWKPPLPTADGGVVRGPSVVSPSFDELLAGGPSAGLASLSEAGPLALPLSVGAESTAVAQNNYGEKISIFRSVNGGP
jgi:hypothetical protein